MTLQLRRGVESGLPTLANGEPAFTTDTHKLFVGQGGVNYQIGGSGGSLDITGLSATDVDVADEFPLYEVSASANKKSTLKRILGYANPALCQGRLTLTSNTPVTTSDVTGATTIYFTPYTGNRISLYDGTRWNLYTFSEISLMPSFAFASKPYDVYVYDNSGTLTLECVIWTSDTLRATAITLQDGVYVQSGSTTRRYLGTVYVDASSQMNDSKAKRHVWNHHNRVRKAVKVTDADASWTYTTATWRQFNGASANQFDVVCGLAGESLLNFTLQAAAANSSGDVVRRVSIGNGGTTPHTDCIVGVGNGAANHMTPLVSTLSVAAPLGRSYYPMLEYSAATGTTTWYGQSTHQVSGLSGNVEC